MSKRSDLIAGLSLAVAAAAAVLAMAHHPTSTHGGGIGDYVHGAMIVLLTIVFFGFAHFALRRGLDELLVLAGLVAYALGLVVNVGAGTINGFVVPALAARGSGAVSHDVFVLCWEANQALAQLGVFATGAAFVLWSLDFLGRPGPVNRTVGVLGLAAGLVPAAALASGRLDMNVAGAFVIYATHAAWTILVGVQLMRGKV